VSFKPWPLVKMYMSISQNDKFSQFELIEKPWVVIVVVGNGSFIEPFLMPITTIKWCLGVMRAP
jgi:hypothetical protein